MQLARNIRLFQWLQWTTYEVVVWLKRREVQRKFYNFYVFLRFSKRCYAFLNLTGFCVANSETFLKKIECILGYRLQAFMYALLKLNYGLDLPFIYDNNLMCSTCWTILISLTVTPVELVLILWVREKKKLFNGKIM